jgi:hypothetical protein
MASSSSALASVNSGPIDSAEYTRNVRSPVRRASSYSSNSSAEPCAF